MMGQNMVFAWESKASVIKQLGREGEKEREHMCSFIEH